MERQKRYHAESPWNNIEKKIPRGCLGYIPATGSVFLCVKNCVLEMCVGFQHGKQKVFNHHF